MYAVSAAESTFADYKVVFTCVCTVCTYAAVPCMFTYNITAEAIAFGPDMLAGKSAKCTYAIVPLVYTGSVTNKAKTHIPLMSANNTAYCTAAVDVVMVASYTTNRADA